MEWKILCSPLHIQGLGIKELCSTFNNLFLGKWLRFNLRERSYVKTFGDSYIRDAFSIWTTSLGKHLIVDDFIKRMMTIMEWCCMCK